MNDEQKQSILEAACEICHYPHICSNDELDLKCGKCPVQIAVDSIETHIRLEVKLEVPKEALEKAVNDAVDRIRRQGFANEEHEEEE